MVKHKIISRYGVIKYCIKSSKNQQLDEMAVQRLKEREIPGLLVVEVNRKKDFFQLIYDVTGLTSLAYFLQQPITKSVFIRLVRSVLAIFTIVPEKHLELSKIQFVKESIFINPASTELFYIYVPIGDYGNEVTIREVLMEISANCHFSLYESNEYFYQFKKFIYEKVTISKLELSALLDNLEGKPVVNQETAQIQCRHCGGIVKADSAFCIHCGKPVTAAPLQNKNIYDPFSQSAEPVGEWGRTGTGRSQTGGNGTTVLGAAPNMYADSESTVILNQQNTSYLVRQRTGERIPVDGFPFRIGKETRQCRYVVSDNRAVSRNHADIFWENGVFLIQDNASTNGTFINGRRIESYRKTEIGNGAQLRLANEDFIFYVAEGEWQ